MIELVAKLVPEAVKKLIPYQSARRIGGSGRIWLNANELEQPLHSSSVDANYNRYPDFLPHDVASAYQRYANTQASTLAVRGADEAIDLLIRTFCKPGQDQIVICSPTYAMYEFCADSLAINTLDVPLQADFNLDVDAIITQAKHANIVFLCSPNNPTGNLIPRNDILSVLEGTQDSALVVVDEAYIEFELQSSIVDLIEQYPHLVVIRTLSKAFGLAAVRCGFILASDEVMSYVTKLVPPYPMPDCSANIVLEALSEKGLETMHQATRSLIETREWFREMLKTFDFIEHSYASATNFVLLKIAPDTDLFAVLLDNGIVARNQTHEPSLSQCVRITIGSKESMIEVIEALTNYSKSNTVNTK
ncbi:histidinol-phosphate transaminase [Vibrio methylphosphonaticus]|uniref:histidinol-phosphate transaminase n=1 Tax=Vibrio methylphosphonaticus TaxID=2946866 RepID=UPI002029C7FC|nr:histidinol-phosphate transaminase [Vibrio methylphosphonaticus]MCL9774716.1 histidinol-phosphate transaminase [Vibrio methylphosphonaticus]